MRDPIGQGAALVEALKTADAATCGEWLAKMDPISIPGIRNAAVLAIMERWTALDPAGALAGAGDDKSRISMVLRQWTHRDPAAALAASDGKFDDAIRQGLLETDPDHASARWREIAPGRPFPVHLLEFALKSQVRHDPEGALRQIPADDDYQTNSIRRGLFGSWMDQDASAALKYAENQGDPHARSQLLKAFAERFPERMESVLTTLEGADKTAMALAIARGKTSQDPLAAARWLRSQVPAEEFAAALTRFTGGQQGISPENLNALLTLCPDSAAADKLLEEMAGDTMRGTVQAWLKSRPPGSLTPARQALAFKMLPAAEAVALVPGGVTFSPEEGRAVMAEATRQWNPGEPAELAANLSALPESLRAAAAGSFLNQERYLSRKDGQFTFLDKLAPETTAGIFASLSPEARARTALNFAWRQQQSDPASAARMLAFSSAAGDDPAAAAVHEQVARAWISRDPAAASAWIQTLPAGPARDAAVLTVIENQAPGHPSTAAGWERTLRDPVAALRARRMLESVSRPDLNQASGSTSTSISPSR